MKNIFIFLFRKQSQIRTLFEKYYQDRIFLFDSFFTGLFSNWDILLERYSSYLEFSSRDTFTYSGSSMFGIVITISKFLLEILFSGHIFLLRKYIWNVIFLWGNFRNSGSLLSKKIFPSRITSKYIWTWQIATAGCQNAWPCISVKKNPTATRVNYPEHRTRTRLGFV